MIRGLHAREQHVRGFPLGDGGQHAGDRDRIGTRRRLVPRADGAIGALGQAFAQDFVGLIGADGYHDHFDGTGGCLLDPDRFFQREIIPLVKIPDEEIRIDLAAVRGNDKIFVQR